MLGRTDLPGFYPAVEQCHADVTLLASLGPVPLKEGRNPRRAPPSSAGRHYYSQAPFHPNCRSVTSTLKNPHGCLDGDSERSRGKEQNLRRLRRPKSAAGRQSPPPPPTQRPGEEQRRGQRPPRPPRAPPAPPTPPPPPPPPRGKKRAPPAPRPKQPPPPPPAPPQKRSPGHKRKKESEGTTKKEPATLDHRDTGPPRHWTTATTYSCVCDTRTTSGSRPIEAPWSPTDPGAQPRHPATFTLQHLQQNQLGISPGSLPSHNHGPGEPSRRARRKSKPIHWARFSGPPPLVSGDERALGPSELEVVDGAAQRQPLLLEPGHDPTLEPRGETGLWVNRSGTTWRMGWRELSAIGVG